MEKKILKGVTVSMGIITVAVCICLCFLPNMKEAWVLAAEKAQEAMQQESLVEIEIEQDIQGDTENKKEKEQLYIELPEGINGKDISIENDYLHQIVYVRFARGVDNYSDNYRVYGSINHIANLTYYKEGEAGVMEIALDQVCEYSYSFEEGCLCIKFIDPHEIYDKVIVVDAGHGGRAPGAVKKDVCEKNLNLEIVLQLKAIFDEVNDEKVKVYYTRLDDTNPSLAERTELANKSNADVFISVHNNASSSGNFNRLNGTMVLYSPSDNNQYNSYRLAELCLQNVLAHTGARDLGLRDADDIYIVVHSDVPVALIEAGYMTNHEELKNLQDSEYQKKVAQGIYDAIMAAFEEGF